MASSHPVFDVFMYALSFASKGWGAGRISGLARGCHTSEAFLKLSSASECEAYGLKLTFELSTQGGTFCVKFKTLNALNPEPDFISSCDNLGFSFDSFSPGCFRVSEKLGNEITWNTPAVHSSNELTELQNSGPTSPSDAESHLFCKPETLRTKVCVSSAGKLGHRRETRLLITICGSALANCRAVSRPAANSPRAKTWQGA